MRRIAVLRRRIAGRLAAIGGACVLALVLLAAPAGAVVVSNTAPIVVPGTGTAGAANPYPSVIGVSGLTGAITNVTATLTGVSHTYPADLDVLLVGPSGQNVVLLADTGAGTDIANVNLTFSGAAATLVPTPITSGTYRPTNLGAFNGAPPAPAAPYGAALSVFSGTVPNGEWRLFVFDDAAGDTGRINGGWSLDITTNGPTVTSYTPAGGPAGTTVVITGTNLTGATSVTFGGIPAASYTVNSPTQITAVVPAGAVSGPISVITPNGIATSAGAFEVSPPPAVTSLAPTSGPVGTTVTLTGANLTGATEVRFAGTPAATFAVTAPTTITATVPAGAGTGPVTVTTPGGTGTSTTPFTVTHARSLSLNVSRNRARGTLNVADGYTKCAVGTRITLQRRARGAWRSVARDVTSGTGRYSIPGRRARGRYRALASATVLASGDSCLRAVSRSVRR
jgi:subtilisin-like proprotein convertase family protein